MDSRARTRTASTLLGLALAISGCAISGCADTSAVDAQEAAKLACSESRVDIAEILIRDVDSLETETLQALADQASDRAEAARVAMLGDDRWNILAEATGIISDYATLMVEESRRGQPPSRALDLSAWDTYKLASNAYGHECRIARGTDASRESG